MTAPLEPSDAWLESEANGGIPDVDGPEDDADTGCTCPISATHCTC